MLKGSSPTETPEEKDGAEKMEEVFSEIDRSDGQKKYVVYGKIFEAKHCAVK